MFDAQVRRKVANLALYVELLHKATLLIDDFIDGDEARHGRPAFHTQFGSHDAILFAIYLVGDCLKELCASTKQIHASRAFPEVIDLVATAIKAMTLGALEEINSSNQELESLAKIKRLTELQTVALVKNGLLVGYKYGRGSSQLTHLIESLGHNAGYLFQALNDLEPFLGKKRNADYKGAVNTDICRSRKNLAMAYLFQHLSTAEQAELRSLIAVSDPLLAARIEALFCKYRIAEYAANNLALVKKNLDRAIASLVVDDERRSSFASFISYVITQALARLDHQQSQKLSAILMR